jgi:DNA-binding PadR family transcriptional regulator
VSLADNRELLLLGLLRDEPMSAYALERAVKMHGHLYGEYSRGNIYEQLVQLERSRIVTSKLSAATRGPRATKTEYALTTAGRRRFDALLAKTITDPQASDAAFEVGCVLLTYITPSAARMLLTKRLSALLAHEKRLGRLFGNPQTGGGAALALQHAKERVRSEIVFTRSQLRGKRR